MRRSAIRAWASTKFTKLNGDGLSAPSFSNRSPAQDRNVSGAIAKIKGMDYYERRDSEYHKKMRVGDTLLNWHRQRLAELPAGARAAVRLGNADVDFDAGLSGVVFEKAPGLPPLYKEKILYWGNGRERGWDTGAVHHQNKAHEYFIMLFFRPLHVP